MIQSLLTHRSLTKSNKELKILQDQNDSMADRIINSRQLLAQHLFTSQFVIDVFNVVIRQFLILTTHNWEAWVSDPESVIMDWESESSVLSVQGCARVLATTLVQKFTEVLVPVITNAINAVLETPTDPNDFAGLVQRDAVYCVVGLSATYLYGHFSFTQFVEKRLLQDAGIRNDEAGRDVGMIIRRRVPWLIQKLDYESPMSEIRDRIYAVLVTLMSSSESSLIVRLEALECFAMSIDFIDPDLFADTSVARPEVEKWLGVAVTCGVELVAVCVDAEVRKLPSRNVRKMIEEARLLIAPHAPLIVSVLPRIWNVDGRDGGNGSAVQEMKTNVLLILLILLKALGNQVDALLSLAIPFIDESVDRNQPYFEFLHVDAIILWTHLLHSTSQQPPSLISLLPKALNLLDSGCEEPDRVFKLLQGYYLLFDIGELVNITNGQLITTITEQISKNTPKSNIKTLTNNLQTLFQTIYHANVFQQLSSSFLPMLRRIAEIVTDISIPTEARCLWITVLARVAVSYPQILVVEETTSSKHQRLIICASTFLLQQLSPESIKTLLGRMVEAAVSYVCAEDWDFVEGSYLRGYDPNEHGVPTDDDDS
ncbi:Importin-11, partial [Nowakowskiella sp. JEL0078]